MKYAVQITSAGMIYIPKLYDDRLRHSNDIKIIASKIWNAEIFVPLMAGIYEISH
jgi:hypothetical protein